MVKMSIFELIKLMICWLSTLWKMSFKEEAVMFCRSGQSTSICFADSGASQDAHVGWCSPDGR